MKDASAVAIVSVLLLCDAVFAQDPPDIQSLLEKVDVATKAVQAVSYDAEFYGEGELSDRLPRIRGSVIAVKGRKSFWKKLFRGKPDRNMFRFHGVRTLPGSSIEEPFDVATDGNAMISIDKKQKRCIHGNLPIARSLLNDGLPLLMNEYLHAAPFDDELQARQTRYEGVQTIGGVACDVIYVVYQNQSESRWFFGRQDSLPRRVERIITRSPQPGKIILTLSKLNVAPKLASHVFRPKCPSGYDTQTYEAPQRPRLLALDSEAPAWKLQTPAGQAVRLSELHGNVVVLAFWATWCGPCKLSMPGLQKIHEQFKDQPVRVFAVNCHERGDPVDYMRSKGYTYPLLINADQMAKDYHVSSIPAYYVIGPKGHVVYAASGYRPNRESKLKSIIHNTLRQIERPVELFDAPISPTWRAPM